MKNKLYFSAIAAAVLLSIGAVSGGGLQSAAAAKTIVNAAQAQEAMRLKGAINGNRIEMTMRRSGDTLTGSYYYIKSGSANSLKLSGKIGADNKFTLQETNAGGKMTGTFDGYWTAEPHDVGVSLNGDWKKPGAAADDTSYFYVNEQMSMMTGGMQIVSREIKENIKGKRFESTTEYPEITGGSTAGIVSFNRITKARALKLAADFKKDIMSMTAEDVASIPDSMSYYVEVGYNVVYADNNLVSIKFSDTGFSGGAHPNTNYYTLNFDLKSGKELKLADLFKPGAKYLQTIAAYSLKDLQSRKNAETGESEGVATDDWAEGASAKDENYESWNITKKGLLFTFDPYQVASYANGPQTVIMPYDKLKTIAKPDGAMSKIN